MNEQASSTGRSRYRISFAKNAPLRFTSHLDLHRALERCFRRARIPLTYSQGYNPRPRINLSPALPLGCTSDCELVDIWLEKKIQPSETLQALNLAAPDGLQFFAMEIVSDHLPSLQTQVIAVVYECKIDPDQSSDDLGAVINTLVDLKEIPRVRRGKSYDLRPLIENIHSQPQENGSTKLHLRLTSLAGATGRPEEVLLAIGLDPTYVHFRRTGLILSTEHDHQ